MKKIIRWLMTILVVAGMAYRYYLITGTKVVYKIETSRTVFFFPNLLHPTSQEKVFKD